jgi:hypothetical protein
MASLLPLTLLLPTSTGKGALPEKNKDAPFDEENLFADIEPSTVPPKP